MVSLLLYRFDNFECTILSGQIPLIGVGGIETAEDILERMKAGASLVQSK